jgi:hypothetical protein
MMASSTPWQRVEVLEKTQHESVALGELAAQYEHRPDRLLLKPQLLPSLSTPAMHVPVMEFAGKAQLVKSARIWLRAFGPAVPQMLLDADISCSLWA